MSGNEAAKLHSQTDKKKDDRKDELSTIQTCMIVGALLAFSFQFGRYTGVQLVIQEDNRVWAGKILESNIKMALQVDELKQQVVALSSVEPDRKTEGKPAIIKKTKPIGIGPRGALDTTTASRSPYKTDIK